jgi:hypothetical protein
MSGRIPSGLGSAAVGLTFTVFAMVAFAAFGAMLARWLV